MKDIRRTRLAIYGIAALSIAPLFSCGCETFHGQEALFGIDWHRSPQFEFPQRDDIPSEIRDDLANLDRSFEVIIARLHDRDRQRPDVRLRVSPGGHSIAAYDYGRQSFVRHDPTGLWIWPNWRDAQQFIELPEFSNIDYISDRFAIVRHFDRRAILDLNDQNHLIPVPESFVELDVSDDGRFIATDQQRIVAGRISSSAFHEVAKAEAQDGSRVSFMHDGDVMIVASHDFIASYLYANLSHRADEIRHSSGSFFSNGFWLSDSDGLEFVRVDETGRFRRDSDSFVTKVSGVPWRPSPSGDYFLLTTNSLIPSAVNVRIHKFPWVNGPVPSKPKGGVGYWLSWSD